MRPTATEHVWNFLRAQTGLCGFVLISGSALALHLRHSGEDLDIVYLGETLPRERLSALAKSAAQRGLLFTPHDSPAALEEFLLGGMDLLDYQQDYLVNYADQMVKLSFFTPSRGLERVLTASTADGIRVASVPELFRSKCLVSALRSKTRDWLDLYILMTTGGFSISDYREAFVAAGVPSDMELSLTRLCSGRPQRDDEGFSHLLPNPPSIDSMRQFFQNQRDLLEQQDAANALNQRHT